MHIVAIFENKGEAKESMNADLAWAALRRIDEIARKHQFGDDAKANRGLDGIRMECCNAIAVLGEDV